MKYDMPAARQQATGQCARLIASTSALECAILTLLLCKFIDGLRVIDQGDTHSYNDYMQLLDFIIVELARGGEQGQLEAWKLEQLEIVMDKMRYIGGLLLRIWYWEEKCKGIKRW